MNQNIITSLHNGQPKAEAQSGEAKNTHQIFSWRINLDVTQIRTHFVRVVPSQIPFELHTLPVMINYFILFLYVFIWFLTIHHYLCQCQI